MSHRDEVFVVEAVKWEDRLDTYLHQRYPQVSRGAIQRLIEQGHILLNGQPAKPSAHPRGGDQVSVHFPEARPAASQPEDIPLEILFEDKELLVLNKPTGLVVHPAAGHEEHTLVNALLHHCAGQLSGIGGVARPGIVHRLDKETSGCLVVAKTDAAHLALSAQFHERQVEKKYYALLCGNLPKAQGEVRASIARHPTHRKRMAVSDGGGREALTTYRVLQRLQASCLVEAGIHTGRTHQIRVHFQHLGHPLVGDQTYGKRQNSRLKELTGFMAPRVLLHAHSLSFDHPVTGQPLSFQSPLPPDFLEAIRALGGTID